MSVFGYIQRRLRLSKYLLKMNECFPVTGFVHFAYNSSTDYACRLQMAFSFALLPQNNMILNCFDFDRLGLKIYIKGLTASKSLIMIPVSTERRLYCLVADSSASSCPSFQPTLVIYINESFPYKWCE